MTKTAFDRGIGWGCLMVAVGFRGGDGQKQGGGKVVGENRQGHRCNNQIKVMAVAAGGSCGGGGGGSGSGGGSGIKRQ
jgi:hypothetical protein